MGVKRSLIHLNGHQLCAVDTETTGLHPRYNEIIQFSVVPLDALYNPLEGVPFLDLVIKPDHPNRASQEAINKVGRDRFNTAVTSGMDSEAALELFEQWFSNLPLPENKRIVPLGQNWPFDRQFLSNWMGHEHFNHYFDSRARDTMTVASYLNDRADFSGEQIPFPKSLELSMLAKRLGIEVDGKLHDSLYDCLLAGKVMKAMLLEPFV